MGSYLYTLLAGSLQIGIWKLDSNEGPLEQAHFDLSVIRQGGVPISTYVLALPVRHADVYHSSCELHAGFGGLQGQQVSIEQAQYAGCYVEEAVSYFVSLCTTHPSEPPVLAHGTIHSHCIRRRAWL